MKHIILTLIVSLCSVLSAVADNVITYVCDYQLEIDASVSMGANLVSHTYDAATHRGTVTYDAPIKEAKRFFSNSPYTAYYNKDIELTFPSTVESVGSLAFSKCNITRIDLGGNVKLIDSKGFYNCQRLCEVIVGSKLEEIKNGAFNNCIHLTHIDLPEGLKAVGSTAFEYCRSLTSCEFPSTLETLGNDAFHGTSGLTSVTFASAQPPTLGKTVFRESNPALSIKVPNAAYDTYVSAWTDLAQKIYFSTPAHVDFYTEGGGSYARLQAPGKFPSTHLEYDLYRPETVKVKIYVMGTSCQFVSWDDGDTSEERTFTLGYDGDKTYKALFMETDNSKGQRIDAVSYASSQGSVVGTITASGESANVANRWYADGTHLTITAQAAPGYTFDRWSDGDPRATRNIDIHTGFSIQLEAYFRPNNWQDILRAIAADYRLTIGTNNVSYKIDTDGKLTVTTDDEGEGYSMSGNIGNNLKALITTPYGYALHSSFDKDGDERICLGFRMRDGHATHLIVGDEQLLLHPNQDVELNMGVFEYFDCYLSSPSLGETETDILETTAMLRYLDAEDNLHVELYNTRQMCDKSQVISYTGSSETLFIEANGSNVIYLSDTNQTGIYSEAPLDIFLPLPTDTLVICTEHSDCCGIDNDISTINIHGKGILRIMTPEGKGIVYYEKDDFTLDGGVSLEIASDEALSCSRHGINITDGSVSIISDMDGDGKISRSDLDELTAVLKGEKTITIDPDDYQDGNNDVHDANIDGKITIADLTRLIRFLNWKMPELIYVE